MSIDWYSENINVRTIESSRGGEKEILRNSKVSDRLVQLKLHGEIMIGLGTGE